MKKVLFVCTGNTCRSCMAEAIFRYGIGNSSKLEGEYIVASAGLAAYEGDMASENAVRALKEEWGIDISSHRAKKLTVNDIKEADIILTMTRSHKNSILSEFPELKNKVFTLVEFASEDKLIPEMREYNYALDIQDPYGMPLNMYKKSAMDIKKAVDKLIKKLESGA